MTTTPLPDWSHAVADIPSGGLARERKASDEALLQFKDALGLLSLAEVSTRYRIDRLAGGAYRLSGRVSATGEQACVVTVEPVAASLDEPFDVEFWSDLPESDGGEDKSILDERDVEHLENGSIPVGRIVFDWSDKAPETPGKISPFEALAKLKGKL
jgi:hypothetical protein